MCQGKPTASAERSQFGRERHTCPSERGGVAITMVLQPAIWAGTAIMSVLLGSTAVPPGTYKPTAPAWQSLVRLHARHDAPALASFIAIRYCMCNHSTQSTAATEIVLQFFEWV